MSEREILEGVTVRPITDCERKRYDGLLDEQHYLKSGRLVGEQMRYVAECGGRWLALLSWSAGSFHLADRDEWIGWSGEQRRRRLPLAVNNSRFLILEGEGCPNLASRVMGLCLRRLCADWEAACSHGALVAESFVDPQLFRGTAYQAGGWLRLGETRGYSRVRSEYYTGHDRPKHLCVRELRDGARALLSAERMPEEFLGAEPTPKPRCRTGAEELRTVRGHFESMADYRTGANWRYSHSGLLTLVFCAAVSGVSRGQRDLAECAAGLGQGQLRALGFRPDRGTRVIPHPKETSFFRLPGRTAPAELQETLLKCLDSLLGPEAGPEAVIIDGKALRSSRGVRPVSAFSADTGRWLGSETAGDKSNEIPAARRLIERVGAEGSLVLADAPRTQSLTAREVVQDCGADCLMTVKGNRKGLRKTLSQVYGARKTGAFPPSDGGAAAR